MKFSQCNPWKGASQRHPAPVVLHVPAWLQSRSDEHTEEEEVVVEEEEEEEEGVGVAPG